jgi:hypothetical protein
MKIFLLVLLFCFHAKAYQCTFYTGVNGQHVLPGDCYPLVATEEKNPSNILKLLSEKLFRPYEYKNMKVGGQILSNVHKLNDLFLQFDLNYSSVLTSSDNEFLNILRNQRFQHNMSDIYRPTTVMMSSNILQGKDSSIRIAVGECSKTFPLKNCEAKAIFAWKNYLSDVSAAILSQNNEAYLESIQNIISGLAVNDEPARFAYKVLQNNQMTANGVLKNLPFLSSSMYPNVHLEFDNNHYLTLDQNQVELLNLLNSTLLLKSLYLQSCFQQKCYESGKSGMGFYALEAFLHYIKGLDQLSYLVANHLTFRKTEVSPEEIGNLKDLVFHSSSLHYSLSLLNSSTPVELKKTVTMRSEFLKLVLSFMAKKLYSTEALKSAHGIEKVRIAQSLEERIVLGTGLTRPQWWGKSTPLFETFVQHGSLPGQSFLDLFKSLSERLSGNAYSPELVKSAVEILGAWNPWFLMNLRNKGVTAFLNENPDILESKRELVENYMKTASDNDSYKDFLRKLGRH